MVLLDPDGVVCAEGCITGFNSIHSRPVPPGQISVVLTSVVEGKSVSPPYPTPFDGDKIDVGGFYAWPLAGLRPK